MSTQNNLIPNGNVYLLHFDRPISDNHTTQHYVGYAQTDYAVRCANHTARLVVVAKERGIGFVACRVWAGGRDLERRIKSWHNHKFLCPFCMGEEAQNIKGVYEVFRIRPDRGVNAPC